MVSLAEKLAQSLQALYELQTQGLVAIQSKQLSRVHRERLLQHGFLEEVIKGWYIPSRPDLQPGESTSWYTSYWDFCAAYLNERFKQDWCLSPEQSLLLHAGQWTVPRQLLVHASKGTNKITQLPHQTSLFDARYTLPPSKYISTIQKLRLFSIPSALVYCSPKFFIQSPTETRAVLAALQDPSELLNILLEQGHTVIAGRLVGALRHIGRESMAEEILKTMQAAGHEVRENNPFDIEPVTLLSNRQQSPYVHRLQLMWQQMRNDVMEHFPIASPLSSNIENYLMHVDEIYTTDAYHSLSIEGYRVSPRLIERVKSGRWDPRNIEADLKDQDALAARGYWQAFQAVKKSVTRVLEHENSGIVIQQDLSHWFRELFAPSVAAGILKPTDLAGYRNQAVYIRRSMHVPPPHEAVRELMPTFFQLICEEQDARVRIVLGHFFFVNIHPYMDGNGRIGRFLMNVLFAAGGYPWTIIPVEKRNAYMTALEAASVEQRIQPFCDFLAGCISSSWS
jgi:hypothetical protein